MANYLIVEKWFADELEAATGGGNVTLALTGVAGVGVVGSLGVTGGEKTLALTGVAGVGVVGSLTRNLDKALTGNAGTGVVGTLTRNTSYTLGNVAGTGIVGSLTRNTSYALTAVAGTGAIGTLASNVSYGLTQVAGSGVVGTLTANTGTPDVTVALTGVSGAGVVGSLTRNLSYALTGAAGTGVVGLLTSSLSNALSGVTGVGVVGSLTAVPTYSLTQVSGLGVVGALTTSLSKSLTQDAGTGVVGSLISNPTYALTQVAGVGVANSGSAAADDFAGLTSGTNLSTRSPWSAKTGALLGEASGSRVRPSGGGDQIYRYESGTWANDHYAECVVAWTGTGTSCMGVAVRLSATGSGYGFEVNENGAGFLNCYTNGTYNGTTLASPTGIASGSVVRLSVVGTTLKVYDDGVEIVSVTDSSFASGLPGLNGVGNSATIWADNWAAADASSGGVKAQVTYGLTEVAGTGVVGSLVADTGSPDVTRSLSGVAGAGVVGSVGAAISSALTGVSALGKVNPAASIFRSVSSNTYTGAISSDSVSVPSGVVDGDLLIHVHIIHKSAGLPPAVTLPPGFTRFSGFPYQGALDGSSGNIATDISWKVADHEGADYTSSWTGSCAAESMVFAVPGALAADVQITQNTAGAGTSATATGLTTQRPNSLVAFLAVAYNFFGAASPPAGTTPSFTEQSDLGTSLIYLATGVLAAQSATGNQTQTVPEAPWSAFLIEIPTPVGIVAQVSAPLTQVSGPGAVGTLSSSISYGLTQAAGAGVVGTVVADTGSPDVTKALTGVSGLGVAGSLGAALTTSLSQAAAPGVVGSLTSTPTYALGSVSGSGVVGALSVASDVALSGVQGLGVVGNLTLQSSDVTIALTGVAGIGVVGNLVASGGDAVIAPAGGGGPDEFEEHLAAGTKAAKERYRKPKPVEPPAQAPVEPELPTPQPKPARAARAAPAGSAGLSDTRPVVETESVDPRAEEEAALLMQVVLGHVMQLEADQAQTDAEELALLTALLHS